MLCNDSDCYVLGIIAERKHLPTDILNALARNNDIAIRIAIAERKDLTNEITSRLAHDDNEYVRLYIARVDCICNITQRNII